MFHKLPIFAATTSYKRPENPKWTPHGFSKHFYGDYFEYLQADKISGTSFDLTMQGYNADRASWLVPYPAMHELMGAFGEGAGGGYGKTGGDDGAKKEEKDDVLVVDVGGGLVSV